MIDRVVIEISAGKGGDGLISFHRGKYLPFGGPDGGDGGKGGDVVVVGDDSYNDLTHLSAGKKYLARHGMSGGKDKRRGKSAENLKIQVPVGTAITEMNEKEKGVFIADVLKSGEKHVLAKGGKGGLGNVHFATSRNQAPRKATVGEDGESYRLLLQYKMVTDVCLIGKPNSGKSSLLTRLTRAKPRIADYPFSTQIAQMGVMDGKVRDYVVAEMPALVDGSANGKGLGNYFLQHAERTGFLIYVLDYNSTNIMEDIAILDRELALYSELLVRKVKVITVNKIDLAEDKSKIKETQQLMESLDIPFHLISLKEDTGVLEFVERLTKLLDTMTVHEQREIGSTIKIFRPKPRL